MRYDYALLDAGPLALDGGAMFGLIPKAIWANKMTPDDRNRVVIAQNCLLLRPADLPEARPVLIDSGSGDKFDEKMRGIYGMSDRTVLTALQEHNVAPADVGHVVLTHLHFDHAGGLTRIEEGRAVPNIPDAKIYVQRREWEDATHNTSVMGRTYLPENLEPIEANLKLLDSPLPFPDGFVPRRDESPPGRLEDRLEEVLPGLSVFRVPGHTWGQQAVLFDDARGRPTCFVPDVMPTVHHVGFAYSLGYDVEPYRSAVTRRWLLSEAADRGWTLVLCHEPTTPRVRVRREGDWFALDPAES